MRWIIGMVGAGRLAVAVQAQLPVTNGLTLWLKADAIAGLTNGQAVTSWLDSSPSGNHATQSNAAKQPLYVSGAPNGRPVVRFDGDRTADGANADHLTLSGRALAGLSFFLVARPANGLNAYALTFGSNHRGVVFGFETNPTQWNWFDDRFTPVADVDLTQFQIVSYTEGSALCDALWFVGSDIGSVAPFAGDLAEVLVYDHALSLADRQVVSDYLTVKWKIHPTNE